MQPRFDLVEDQRAIIDRRRLAERLAEAPADQRATILAHALDDGRAQIARRLAAEPARGRAAAAGMAFLAEQILRLAFDQAVADLPEGVALAREVALVAQGGTGRGEMAPFSDVDLLFLVARGAHARVRPLIEATLYLVWDCKWVIGHAVRDSDELVALTRADLTARTAFLEARWLWGERRLFDEALQRFRREVVEPEGKAFVAAKMEERDERHRKTGDSRYLVEPNVKDGKGGLRDLHTLRWIAEHLYAVESTAAMVDKGLLTRMELVRFERAERFFLAVRGHLHVIAGRAEERLGFHYQRDIAAAMRYADRPGKSAVERFMHFYFLQAKAVGELTGVFLARVDEQMGKAGRRFALPTFQRRPRKLDGFVLDRGRLSVPDDQFLAADPVRLVEMFALAATERLEIHPRVMRSATEHARLVDQVRDDPKANAFFLDVLTCKDNPDLVLRWMNEAGVFGRFVPDFGKVVAQMQFDMYHHYTVDEHTIRAIGLLAAIERGELADDHPLATALFRQIGSRRTLYVAVLLHDIAKGRGGDHSELGADVAMELGPRFGLDEAETETVAWLVREHLLMSRTAFRRDLTDPKTVEDFVAVVQSAERLRLLLMLTVVDIRAVGPGTWNEWKRQLLRTLFDAAEERLRLGHKQRGRSEQVTARQEVLARALDWPKAALKAHVRRLPDSYWLAEPDEWILANALQIARAEAAVGDVAPNVVVTSDPGWGSTRVSVFSPDRAGLFYRICAGLTLAGASIIDARIHTTRDGMALDNLLVQDSQRRPYGEARLRNRLAKSVEKALASDDLPTLPTLPALPKRRAAFRVAPSVVVAPGASTRTTVVEVNARDRDGLLARLALVIHRLGHQIHSAHITTYGERAVDTFYLTNANGRKLGDEEIARLRADLLEAAGAISAITPSA